MQFGTLWHALPAVLFLCSFSPGEQKPATLSAQAPAKSEKLKLTPEQRHGLRLLKASEGEAAGLEPEMRAFVLWQVSHGYSKILPEKSATVLREAFKVSESVEQDTAPDGCDWEVCHMKRYLQRHLAEEFMKRSETTGQFDEVEQMLPKLEREVRNYTMAQLVIHYAEKNQFHRAQALLGQVGDDEVYPYYAATALMVDDSKPEDRLAIFDEAVRHFREEPTGRPETEDLATIVIRFSRDLPTTQVLDAIDQIFARSKEQDEDKKERVGINSGAGSVYFDSLYQLRLFQLLPVLEDLDKSRAESLLRENAEVNHAFDKYPRGPQSMDPKSFGDKPLPKDEYGSVEVDVVEGEDPSAAAAEQALDSAWAALQAKMEKVIAEVENDPQQAYQDAEELPLTSPFGGNNYSPRASVLGHVAKDAIKKDPAIAKAAMGEMRKLIADMDMATQARLLFVVPNFYVEVGDLEEARNSIKELMKLADRLYARDTDASDPNLVFKGIWPSTALWRRCVEFAAKVSPAFAEEMLAQVPDAEIASFERVTYGGALAGAPPFQASIVEWHKGGRHNAVMY